MSTHITRGAKYVSHKLLSSVYSRHFEIPIPGIKPVDSFDIPSMEREMISSVETPIDHLKIPTDSKSYLRWFIEQINTHKASKHPFYDVFMNNIAGKEDLRFWLAQESTLDPRFDDIIALLQVGTAGSIKMEFAKNYWDEMGNGELNKMHSVLFATLSDQLDVHEEYIQENLLTESLLSGNLSSYYTVRRENFFKALGYFGVTECLAPRRFKAVVKALDRNNFSNEYHKLHIFIDSIHGKGWFNNVIRPIVDKYPLARLDITQGALTRLDTSTTLLDKMLEHLTSVNLKKE